MYEVTSCGFGKIISLICVLNEHTNIGKKGEIEGIAGKNNHLYFSLSPSKTILPWG